jgi:putative MFS transporter
MQRARDATPKVIVCLLGLFVCLFVRLFDDKEENRTQQKATMGKSNYNQVPVGESHEVAEIPGHVVPDDEGLATTTTTNENEDNKQLVVKPPDGPSDCHRHSERMTIDDGIERLGMGKFQVLILTAAGMCFAADAMQVLLLSFLSEVLRLEWNLTDDETAFITSMLFIGAIFGTLLLGPLADKKGRKPVFLLAGTIISIFGLAVGFCTNYWSLLSMLFMVGFGVGGLTVPFDILAECIPSHSRGKNLLIIEYFWTIGVLFVVMIAYFCLGNGQDGHGNWRLFVVISSLPCFVSVVIGCFFVPESPRWLCTVGRCEEALLVLRQAAKANGHDPEILFPEGCEIMEEEEEEADFCELFSPKWRWTTAKLWGAWGAFAFGYYGTIMMITEIFDDAQERSSDAMVGGVPAEETYNFDYGAIFVSSSAELVGTTFAIFSVDRVGRIPLQVVSYAMAGLSVCSLCVLASQGAHRNILITLGFTARIFEMSGSCVSWVSTAEILTTEVRTTGHSAANAVARIGSLFAPFLIEGHSSLTKKGFIMLAIHCITVACVSQLPETKGAHMGASSSPEDLALMEEDEGIIENDESSEDGSAEEHVIT